MNDDVMRLNILPRGAIRYYQPPSPAHWDLSKLKGKWYWRALHWLLKKLGGGYRDYIPESWPIREVKIDQRSIVTLLETSARAMESLWDKRATTLIVGYDEAEKLMNDAPTEMLHFHTSFPIARSERFGREYDMAPHVVTRTVKLRVVLVPWLSGWALLPDLDK